ncbi:MAG: SHOCT domain-containing protein [Candidatus Dormibacteraeota bacterium]|nr:SHOCT domain-containing protein [Candidatus Dormibacteraeota bacterium]
MSQFGWPMMFVGFFVTLLFWGGLTALVVWAILSLTGRRGDGDQALEVLRRRLAAGEISQTEFEQAKRTLGG